MSYQMNIIQCDLSRKGLMHITSINKQMKRIEWEQDDENITPTQWNFNWDDEFILDLLKLGQLGFTGEIELQGEEGEYTKFVVKKDVVDEHYGEIKYNEKADTIHKREVNE